MFQELRIEVNKACNLACDHCYTEKKGPSLLDVEEFIEIINESASRGTESLSLTGGEPLIEKERTLKLIRAGKKAGLVVRLNTNGILISQAIAEELKESGLDEVQISLNSDDPDTFDAFVHRKGAFNKVRDAINYLNKSNIEVTIRYTLMIRNILQLVPTYELIKSWNVRKFKVRNLVQVKNIKEDGWESTQNILKSNLNQLINIAENETVKVYIADDGLMTLPNKKGNCNKLICKCGSEAIFIASDGIVSPCPFLRESKEFELGNILNDNLFDLYSNSSLLKKFVGNKQQEMVGGNDQIENCKASLLTAHAINF